VQFINPIQFKRGGGLLTSPLLNSSWKRDSSTAKPKTCLRSAKLGRHLLA
jgi:hypothetical protein